MTLSAPACDLAPLLERCFLFDAVQDSYEITGISGRLPEWLRGTYYVNGPARFERAGQRYNHWLDGDGMVHAVAFSAESVHARSRFVQTKKLRDEHAAGSFLYRGFGTAFAGDRLRRNVMLEPPVNVSVYIYAERLLAGGEQSLPMELDSETLETRGEYDFDDALNEASPFSAHAKADPSNGHLLNFGISYSASQPMLTVYEFDARAKQIGRRRHALSHPYSVHDFGFTRNFAVFHLSPLLMNFDRFWGDGLSVLDALTWEPEKGSRLLIAPRGKSGEAFGVAIEPRYALHLINCFEKDGAVMADVMELDRPVYPDYRPIPDVFSDVPPCHPVRYIVDLESRQVRERICMRCDWSPDFPSVNAAHAGGEYNDFWALGIGASGQPGRKFFDRVFRGCWKDGAIADSYAFPAGEYAGGEPICLANPADPDECVVMIQHLQPGMGKASFVLFDAFNLRAGPLARLPLRHFIHPGFHAGFAARK